MTKDQLLTRLREHQVELRALGIEHLSLFGSKARGDDTAASDVDLVAIFDTGRRFSLLDMVSLENRLSDLLEKPVDLAPERALKDGIRERVLSEAVRAF
jgi:predicted nucleotidyltransferase